MKLISFRRLKPLCCWKLYYTTEWKCQLNRKLCASKYCPIWKKLKEPKPEVVYKYREYGGYWK